MPWIWQFSATSTPQNVGGRPLARIDRIEYLITRRRRIEEERGTIRAYALARSLKLISRKLDPVVWVSVIPLYPWRDLCRPSTCYNHFLYSSLQSHEVQRIPDGGLFASEVQLLDWGAIIRETRSCDSRGHFLYVRGLVALAQHQHGPCTVFRQEEVKERIFDFDSVKERIMSMVGEARKFYKNPEVERPGVLSVEIGMSGTSNIRMHACNESVGLRPFLDDEYRYEIVMEAEEFLSSDGKVNQFLDRLAFAFDVTTPAGQ